MLTFDKNKSAKANKKIPNEHMIMLVEQEVPAVFTEKEKKSA